VFPGIYAHIYDLGGRFPKGFILQTLLLLNRKKMAYDILSPLCQSSSSVYSLYLGTEGKSHWRGANELAWKPYWVYFENEHRFL